MTPTQYVKKMMVLINGKVAMTEKVIVSLNKAYHTFTPTQQTFCSMAIFGPTAATKAIKKQKRKGTH